LIMYESLMNYFLLDLEANRQIFEKNRFLSIESNQPISCFSTVSIFIAVMRKFDFFIL